MSSAEFDAAKAKALRFFSEEPWWLDNMVTAILDDARLARFHEEAVPRRGERRDWVVVAGNKPITFRAFTREELDREVRFLESQFAVVYVEGDA